MRKINVFIMLILCLFLIGCHDDNSDKFTIVATIFPHYDIARAIVKDKADVKLALDPGVDSHNFDPSVEGILQIKKSNLFIYTGDFMEPWAVDLKTDPSGYLDLSKVTGIRLEEIHSKDHQHDDTTHSHEHLVDPHIWTSPSNLLLMTDAICEKIISLDEGNKDFYLENANAYKAEIQKIILDLNAIKELSINTTFYFGSPFAFYYLFTEFELEYYSVYKTCSVEVDPSMNDILDITRLLVDNNIKYLLVKELSATNVAESIVADTTVELALLHSGHNLSKEDFDRGITLIDIMKSNVQVLRKAIV